MSESNYPWGKVYPLEKCPRWYWQLHPYDQTVFKQALLAKRVPVCGGFLRLTVKSWEDACLEHDYAYWRGGGSVDRAEADRGLYYDLLEVASKPVAMLAWLGVRCFGWMHFQWGTPKVYRDLYELEKRPYVMSDKEKREQRISFAYGNLKIDDSSVSRSVVEEASNKLYGKPTES